MSEFNFDDIRPYTEEEAQEAIKRIVVQDELRTILEYLFGKGNHTDLTKLASEAVSIADFQKKFIKPLVLKILGDTSDGLSTSGFDSSADISRLYIANHRDITLDSSILASVLVEKNKEACEFTWGDNLMVSPFVTDMGKINRMITVFREGKPRETLYNAQKLSAYIRKKITKDNHSVWIAQRKGRAKDGNDKTDVGVLKMLSLSGEGDLITRLMALNITPVSISYEWEPCDARKIREIYISQSKNYVKTQNEDLQSIIGGILSKKGRIHIAMGKSINHEYNKINKGLPNNELLQQIAHLIDIEIYRNYRLWPTNFLAYDLLHKTQQFTDHYTEGTKIGFEERMKQAVAGKDGDKSDAIELFLKMYAQPVINKLQYDLPPDEPKPETK